jgi:long-chain acyl-CoA synthetase
LELKLTSDYLARLWVYGDSLKSQLIGVGVANVDAITLWAKSQGINGNIDELLANDQVKKLVLSDLEKKGKEVKLKGFEFIKKVHLVAKDFDSIDGTTPTMKLKRNVLKDYYQPQINEMYEQLEKETPAAN